MPTQLMQNEVDHSLIKNNSNVAHLIV